MGMGGLCARWLHGSAIKIGLTGRQKVGAVPIALACRSVGVLEVNG